MREKDVSGRVGSKRNLRSHLDLSQLIDKEAVCREETGLRQMMH
jgi:hypothetical protein